MDFFRIGGITCGFDAVRAEFCLLSVKLDKGTSLS